VPAMTEPSGCLTVEFDRAGPDLTVRLVGELDLTVAPAMAEQVRHEADGSVRRVMLDVSDLTYCDSSGLAALVTIHRHLQETGAEGSIHQPQDIVRQVLEVTGITSVIPISD
jgi:anti-sigma B factor antagonist